MGNAEHNSSHPWKSIASGVQQIEITLCRWSETTDRTPSAHHSHGNAGACTNESLKQENHIK